MKLGFSADDLRSKDRFFKKLGEIAVAKIPKKISLEEVSSNSLEHCGLVTPAQLIERALPHRQPNAKQLNLDKCVSAYEQSLNENLTWRRSVGISANEAREAVKRRKNAALA